MQPRHLEGRPDGRAKSIAVAQERNEPLSDWALVSLLGGTYLAGLGAFLGVVYALNQLF
jgi:hypothetical protein